MENVSYPLDEGAKRIEIWNILQRMCNWGLMTIAYGNVSARWKGIDFLITPTRKSRWDMEFTDMMQIKAGKRESGKIPSRTVRIRHEIYNETLKSIRSLLRKRHISWPLDLPIVLLIYALYPKAGSFFRIYLH